VYNGLSIDVEDWYQGVGLPFDSWGEYEKRLMIGMENILSCLACHNTKATFFVLGKVIEEYPSLIQSLINEGHEIGCHTMTHTELYKSTPEKLTAEIQKCQNLIAKFNIQFKGFRAPYFSVDHRSLWALNVVKNAGFLYDSSIFPGDSKRTGIKSAPKEIHQLENGLKELPVSTARFLRQDVGLGGSYFRILPYRIFRKLFQQVNKAGRSVIFYTHPWEYDPHHPYLKKMSTRIRLPHYFNLMSTLKKLNYLLRDFKFQPLNELIKSE
jgi:polysaccharide deacetylase family protein (PEP-CTERM system associated)